MVLPGSLIFEFWVGWRVLPGGLGYQRCADLAICERVPWSEQLSAKAAAELSAEVFFSRGTSTWLPTALEDQKFSNKLK